jgi:hypothetical protein
MTNRVSAMPSRPSAATRIVLLAASAGLVLAAFALSARADDHRGGRDDHRGGDRHDFHGHRDGGGGGYYGAPPVVYGGGGGYYPPPPVAYSPGVNFNLPGISINVP